MLDDLIERLQADAGFRTFLLDGQTVLLEDYWVSARARKRPQGAREDGPPAGRSVVRAGDELIPSGESLIRNLLLGTADAERLGGRLDVLYSPMRSATPPFSRRLRASSV